MKAFILILFTCLALSTKAADIPLDSIYNAVFAFQMKHELIDSTNYENHRNIFFDYVAKKCLKQSDIGICPIYFDSSIEYINFVIIEKKSFLIVNMHDPLEKNVEIFLKYFKRNNIPDKQILEYLFYLAWIAKRNDITERFEFIHTSPINTWEISREPEQFFDTSQPKIKRFSPKSNLSYFIYSSFGITNFGIIEKKKISLLNMRNALFENLYSLVDCLKRNNSERDEIFKYTRLLNKIYSENCANLELLFKSPVSRYDTIMLKINGKKR